MLPSFDEWRENWHRVAEEKGHVLKRDSDFGLEIDDFVEDIGYHNGPGCINCNMSWCMHCTPMEKIQPCKIRK